MKRENIILIMVTGILFLGLSLIIASMTEAAAYAAEDERDKDPRRMVILKNLADLGTSGLADLGGLMVEEDKRPTERLYRYPSACPSSPVAIPLDEDQLERRIQVLYEDFYRTHEQIEGLVTLMGKLHADKRHLRVQLMSTLPILSEERRKKLLLSYYHLNRHQRAFLSLEGSALLYLLSDESLRDFRLTHRKLREYSLSILKDRVITGDLINPIPAEDD